MKRARTNQNLSTLTQQLLTEGAITYPTFSSELATKIGLKLVTIASTAPELKQPHQPITFTNPKTKKSKTLPPTFAPGGFGALGFASSFHHPYIRKIRNTTYSKLDQLLLIVQQQLNKEHTELLFDRLLIRNSYQKPSSESPHRDITPDITDPILGGWVNLTNQPQYFHYHPRTWDPIAHQTNSRTGFSNKLSPTDKKLIETNPLQTITIQPGHSLLFFQSSLHIVRSQKSKTRQIRLFLGARFTNSNQPILGAAKLASLIYTQSPIPLKSLQPPPLYPKLWDVNWQHRRDAYLDTLTVETKQKINKKQRTGPSLHSLNALYQPYSPSELSLFFPTKSKSFNKVEKIKI